MCQITPSVIGLAFFTFDSCKVFCTVLGDHAFLGVLHEYSSM